MTDVSANNKRIAKNTIFLYIRTFLIMLITLYTSRVVLNVLGVEDYGIYNVVGGVVAMFTVISGSLSAAISRFITFELGKGNLEHLRRIFSTSINIQLGISLLIFIVGEVAGVWFLNHKMNIPSERMLAANWVLHCSLLSFVINLISTPYNACIIAHERMKTFAYVSILEASLKLGIVYLLLASPFDKLSTYAVLLVVVALLIRLAYGIYCKRQFEECTYYFVYDKGIVKEMTGFAIWNFFGNTAYIFNTQGVNILINLFFGVTVNAARGIATQVEGAVMQFVGNFTTAVNPQITKSYATGDKAYMFRLVCMGAKYAYFLLLLFVVPIVLEADMILSLWLKVVPDYASLFLKLSMFGSLVFLLGNTMYTAAAATGKIRKYQFWVTIVGCLVFPLTWLAYKAGSPVYVTYLVYIGIYLVLVFVRLYILKGLLNFPVMVFIREVMMRLFLVTPSAFLIPWFVTYYVEPSLVRLVIVCILSVISTCMCIYVLGLESVERKNWTRKAVSLLQTRFRRGNN